jgi:hypothetical protein
MAIGIDRGATGTPVGKMPQGKENSEEAEYLASMLSTYTTHQAGYIILPHGWELDELKLTFDADKVQKVIDGENIQMAKAFLENFMELGLSSQKGSYSLGSDLSDIFLSGIQYYADKIIQRINRQIIPPLVDVKFGERDSYPELKVSGINDKAGKELAEIITMLTSAGIIEANDRLEAFVSNQYGLPELTKEELEEREKEKEQEEKNEDDIEENNDEEIMQDKKENTEEEKKKIEAAFAESKNISNQIKNESNVLEDIIFDTLTVNSHDYIARITKKMKKKKTPNLAKRDVFNTKIKGLNEYKKNLKKFLTDVAIKNRKEIVNAIKSNSAKLAEEELPNEITSMVNSQSDLIAEGHYDRIESSVLFTFNTTAPTTDSAAIVSKKMTQLVDNYLESNILSTSAVNAVSSITNATRNITFQEPEVLNEIESFVYTNSGPVSQICKELTGRVFTREEFESSGLLPPNHHNCKSYIVAQTKGATNNKPISPLGLTITGSPQRVEAVINSVTL